MVRVRRERPADRAAVQALIGAAFAAADQPDPPVEVALNDHLRSDPAFIPGLTLVADADGVVVGQLTCSYGLLDDAAGTRLVGVGPVAVLPVQQGRGIGSLLLRTLIAAADAAGERALILLGSVDFYRRFGFVPAADLGIGAPDPAWGSHFQARPLDSYRTGTAGRFRYAAPFEGL